MECIANWSALVCISECLSAVTSTRTNCPVRSLTLSSAQRWPWSICELLNFLFQNVFAIRWHFTDTLRYLPQAPWRKQIHREYPRLSWACQYTWSCVSFLNFAKRNGSDESIHNSVSNIFLKRFFFWNEYQIWNWQPFLWSGLHVDWTDGWTEIPSLARFLQIWRTSPK